MDWIHQYQLFLFDFDGLLVNTEELHYLAYKKTFAEHGVDFQWDFNRYCQYAHYDADGLKNAVTIHFPELFEGGRTWDMLYDRKRQALVEIVKAGKAHLMPGVEPLLKRLEEADVKRCVVTHSPDILIHTIREQQPLLHSIPNWITREDYHHPKPNPECYRLAIQRYAKETDQIIGFEDTPRGLAALMETRAQPVLIATMPYPEIPLFKKKGALHFPTLEAAGKEL